MLVNEIWVCDCNHWLWVVGEGWLACESGFESLLFFPDNCWFRRNAVYIIEGPPAQIQ